MRREETIDFDYHPKAKELAFRTVRLAFAILFGSTLGSFHKIFDPDVSAFWIISSILSLFYPFLTFLDWFLEPQPYHG